MLSRRSFLAALAGLPVLGKLMREPEPAPITIPGGENFVGYSVPTHGDYGPVTTVVTGNPWVVSEWQVETASGWRKVETHIRKV